jgi:hypothetical protein
MRRTFLTLLTWSVATGSLAGQEPMPVRGFPSDSTLGFLAPHVGEWAPQLSDSLIRQIGFQPIVGN